MRTYWIETLGCKVNQYESEQLASLLRARGLVPGGSADADVRVINTCSVTLQAASKSRQLIRRTVRLPVLPSHGKEPARNLPIARRAGSKTIVTGCWATSNANEAAKIPGVDAVLTHHMDIAEQLNAILDRWLQTDHPPCGDERSGLHKQRGRVSFGNDGSMIKEGTPVPQATGHYPANGKIVKQNPVIGTRSLPLLGERQSGHQRAFLKVQDGCDAHCTYCIIPQLRPSLWSKPIDDVVAEAQALVDSGHIEIVLTGIFLGAFGHATALRRRQGANASGHPLAQLAEALCTRVRGLRRLRFSSLEPGDLSAELLRRLSSLPQVVPHFHLPLQSGSDAILRRMNRQYTRDDFLRMIEQVHAAFDRPAITTDIICGFPGETDAEFARTLEIVEHARFIHIHAFSFSPRPGTAAARWGDDFVHGPVVNERIDALNQRAADHSFQFRGQFVGETVELLVERPKPAEPVRHGRTARYFDVWFESNDVQAGDAVNVRIDRVTPQRTFGSGPLREGDDAVVHSALLKVRRE